MIGQLEGQVNSVNKLAADVPQGNASTANVGENRDGRWPIRSTSARKASPAPNSTLAVAGSQNQILEVEALRLKVCDLGRHQDVGRRRRRGAGRRLYRQAGEQDASRHGCARGQSGASMSLWTATRCATPNSMRRQ